MSFAQILVPLTGGQRDEIVLAGAFAFAKPFQGHVVGLFVRPDPVEAMPFYGEGMSSAVVQEIMDVSKKATSEASRKALATLVAAAERTNAVIADPATAAGPSGSFREVEGAFAEQVARAATLSDVVVFGPLRENDRPGLSEAFESTLLSIGRPILLVTQEGSFDFTKIAIAWNGSIASAHAVSAALPLLKKASKVEILVVKRPNNEPIETDDIQTYLRLHEVETAASLVEAADRPVADVLLDAAAERGARMLVAGGYGHNRLRELFVTGTTRRVVAKTAIPCFLVH